MITPDDPHYLINNFAVISDDQKYRYVLGRKVEGTPDGARVVLWVMVNPSTAGEFTDDATIRKVMGFSKRWGFNHFRVVNLYAYRTKDIDLLAAMGGEAGIVAGPTYNIVGEDNDMHIARQAKIADQIICAWGAKEKLPKRTGPQRHENVLKILQQATVDRAHTLFSLGLTKSGYPGHPLMIGYAKEREEYGRG